MTISLENALTGISGILVTPYDAEGRIAPERLAPILDRALGAGMHLPVINGNTSEFYALTTDEACTMVREVVGLVAKRAPVLAGVGRAIGDARRLARASADAGAAGLMIHQPPDPFVAARGVVDYLKAVADASGGLPMMLYLRNDAIGTAAIADLCAVPGVRGVKWATPNPLRLAEAKAACDPSIVWVGGLAEVWAPIFYAVGARGFTSGLVNVWPERSLAIHGALEAGNYQVANALIAGMKAFEDIRAEEMNGANVSVVKAALQALGLDCGPTRPPSAWPLTPAQKAKLHAFLGDHQLAGLRHMDRVSGAGILP
ncbi:MULTISPECIES: dihydrodipicolinate synthase family protein [unclassified Chelatococcus]|uniref:dihydrodipicolinate synthase family protein n=1 Tax=unclassified Chelatococcus TaxID=2638111 RepID=UPI001BCB1197|nr:MULTISPECIES: dihydrodipicolinate synthase family protein [unclassified Chelatococcus]CAH1660808.1 Dihydrodipicolinate synthase family protein [Hyphomicrobiales bacterium]MBS7741171.1 dihydrodipicolinate synthase family protein [Chelatococcus sp. HY11]MBX3545357.1 dihydrodipicolinate synthase family protein [Chelatococcus sp.]MCO5077992.1 dihydrodipicolinate synthase family protein [Chelatococcus sp.]CAH1683290.1 Dihydrodipicolinate synthase family protein [Hyphomicrobiales bacterium]